MKIYIFPLSFFNVYPTHLFLIHLVHSVREVEDFTNRLEFVQIKISCLHSLFQSALKELGINEDVYFNLFCNINPKNKKDEELKAR